MAYCSNCGNQLSDTAKFCSKCGEKIEMNHDLQFQSVEEKSIEESVVKRNTLVYVASILDEKGNMKYGLIDSNGKKLSKFIFDDIRGFNNKISYTSAAINNLYGIIDVNGNWIMNPIYQEISEFNTYGYAVFTKEDKNGVLNTRGEIIISPKYECIVLNDKINNFFVVTKNIQKKYIGIVISEDLKIGFLNEKEQWICEPIFDYVGDIKDTELIPVKKSSISGYVNKVGDWVFKTEYDEVCAFSSNGLALVTDKFGKMGFINKELKLVIDTNLDLDTSSFDDRFGYAIAYVDVKNEFKCGLINSDGKWIIKPEFDGIGDFNFDLNLIQVNIDNLWGIIDFNSKWLRTPIYDSIYPFDDLGFSRVVVNGKYGWIDQNGNLVIDTIYDDIVAYVVRELKQLSLEDEDENEDESPIKPKDGAGLR